MVYRVTYWRCDTLWVVERLLLPRGGGLGICFFLWGVRMFVRSASFVSLKWLLCSVLSHWLRSINIRKVGHNAWAWLAIVLDERVEMLTPRLKVGCYALLAVHVCVLMLCM